MACALHAWAIKRSGKSPVRNLKTFNSVRKRYDFLNKVLYNTFRKASMFQVCYPVYIFMVWCKRRVRVRWNIKKKNMNIHWILAYRATCCHMWLIILVRLFSSILTADWLIATRGLCLRAARNAVITALGLSKYKNKVYNLATPFAGRLFCSGDFNDFSIT